MVMRMAILGNLVKIATVWLANQEVVHPVTSASP